MDPLRLSVNLANDFQPQAIDGEKDIVVDDASFQSVLPGRKLLIVKNLVAQALSNLLENAVKYSDSRTTIRVDAVSIPFKGSPKPGVGIRVSNTGLPLLQAEIGKLQDRRFRGTGAKQRVPAGTGIGLYLAKRIMELHNGTILVQGVNKESRFTLVFPPIKII